MKKDPKLIIFWVFHIIMKFLPSALTYITASTALSYEKHPFIVRGIFLVLFCYAIGSCIWDYFVVKKLRAGEKVNLIPLLVIDIFQLAVSAFVFTKHFLLVMEVWGYDNYFKFLKDYFKEYFEDKYYRYKYRDYFAFFQMFRL